MTTTPVSIENDKRHEERHACNDEEQNSWPFDSACGPWWKVVARRNVSSRVEDGESAGEHREDDQGAREVGEAERHFGNADTELDTL